MPSPSSFHAYGVSLHLPDGDVILTSGNNVTIQPAGDTIIFSVQLPSNIVFNNNTAYQPPLLADAKAPNGSVYYSTTASKLVFKDYAGAIHNLY